MRRPPVLALTLSAVMLACSPTTPSPPPVGVAAAPPAILGRFVDDYGNQYTISATEWLQHPRSRYDVVRWNPSEQYVIARNDAGNPSDGGLYTRIDWMPLQGMAPYTWGFCLSAYRALTAEVAESTHVANRALPRTGCNGYPFSRMRALSKP